MIKHFGILCIYKTKGADQLRGTAQLISTVVFAAKSSTVPLCLPNIQASPMPYLVAEQAGRTWSYVLQDRFLPNRENRTHF